MYVCLCGLDYRYTAIGSNRLVLAQAKYVCAATVVRCALSSGYRCIVG